MWCERLPRAVIVVTAGFGEGRSAEGAELHRRTLDDYETAKLESAKGPGRIDRDSGGKSTGNLCAMPGKVAAGRLDAINFNDAENVLEVVAVVVVDDEWNKVNEAFTTSKGAAHSLPPAEASRRQSNDQRLAHPRSKGRCVVPARIVIGSLSATSTTKPLIKQDRAMRHLTLPWGHGPSATPLLDETIGVLLCQASIAHYKSSRFVGPCPVTVSGRAQRFLMRKAMTEEVEQKSA
jgi:hypothetical protein